MEEDQADVIAFPLFKVTHILTDTIRHLGNSMPTDTLFCRPIPDFDEIWQAWGSTEETNPHQVSAHFNHF